MSFFQEGPGPEGHRGARVVWVCDGKYLLVSGFDRYWIEFLRNVHVFEHLPNRGPFSSSSRSERVLYLYSADALSSGVVASTPVTVSPSTLIPFYDPDTSVVILTGKVHTHPSKNDH